MDADRPRTAPRGRGLTLRVLSSHAFRAGAGVLAALVVMAVAAQHSMLLVDGSSMLPLLRPGQLVVLNPLAYRTSEGPRRGDIIVFRRQTPGPDEFVVKRLIGIPGDQVQVVAGTVFVNGDRLDEPYLLATDDYTYPIGGEPIRVPDAAYFVLGDNRPSSADSHLGWFVPARDLIGRAEPLPMVVPVRVARSTT